ncbi:unnamed protein product [Aphanomyces euteiches]
MQSRPNTLLRMKKIPDPDGKVIVEYAYHVKLRAPFLAIGAAVWKVLTNNLLKPCACDGVQVLLVYLESELTNIEDNAYD